MARTGRYNYSPMTSKRLTMRRTLADRIRGWFYMRRRETPDIFGVTGYR
jgi:hypothetical protein